LGALLNAWEMRKGMLALVAKGDMSEAGLISNTTVHVT
jgi:hypothetical protein